MRVLVAGATGVIGRQLLPLLSTAGHQPVAMAHRPPHAGYQHEFVVADALDAAAVNKAVAEAKPDAVVDMLTAIPNQLRPRRFAADFAMTNRLRTEGTHNLIAAATAAGTQRFVVQGVAFAYRPDSPTLADENTPLWTDAPKQFRSTVHALIEHEQMTRDVGGVVLRFGGLYGPDTSFAPGGSILAAVQAGKLPLVGGGHAVHSFIHTKDAASAIVAALAKDATGAFNIVDDEPVAVRVWIPELAAMLGAPKPKTVPAWLGRLLGGSWSVAFLNELRGADNAKARHHLNWQPSFSSWREGFAAELGS